MKKWKKDCSKRKIYKLVCAAAAAVFLLCGFFLLNEFLIQPGLADQSARNLKGIVDSGSADADSTASPSSGAKDRLSALQKVNPDLVGWITIPNTVIDLPVLQARKSAPDFYLDHDYNKNYTAFGSIFADCSTPVLDPGSKCVILYGHSLLSGRMFTQLSRYKSLDFYKTVPVFSFDTVEGKSQWKVISVFVTNTLPSQGKPFQYIRSSFTGDSDYLNFVYQLRIRSIYNTGVSFNAGDKILLLSTCSYEFKDFREVVAARWVRQGESTSVALNQAAYNSKTVYPDCWYQKYGGTKPFWPESYEQALKNGILSWKEYG